MRRYGYTLLFSLLFAGILFLGACGGKDEPPVEPAWKTLWTENWTEFAPLGWVRHNRLVCTGEADPNLKEGGSFIPATSSWAGFGVVDGASAKDGKLVINDTQNQGNGWALLSQRVFDFTKTLRVSAEVELQTDPGAWIGITFIQDETDYREIALYEKEGALRVGIWAPCYWKDLGPVAKGARKLGLEYHPTEGWTYSVDGVVFGKEPLSSNGAALVGNPRIGIYAVNLIAETTRGFTGSLRATVGALIVETPATD